MVGLLYNTTVHESTFDISFLLQTYFGNYISYRIDFFPKIKAFKKIEYKKSQKIFDIAFLQPWVVGYYRLPNSLNYF